MTTMSMNKAIHAAFRRDLARFDAALARFVDGDRTRARELGRAWANFEDQLVHHHTGEHAIAWPALRELGVPEKVLDAFDAEHDRLSLTLTKADEAMTSLARTAFGGAAARVALDELRDVTDGHFAHEEKVTEPLFAEHAGSDVLKRMGREFGKVSPARSGRFFAWVLDGATPEERAGAVGAIPEPVLAIIGGVFGAPYRLTVAPVWKATASEQRAGARAKRAQSH